MSSNETKDVLEQNVSTLLESGGEAPRIADGARARIREALIEKHGAVATAAPRVRMRTPLLAVGFGLAATAATALVVTKLAGDDDKPAVVDSGSTKLADGSTYITEPGAKVTVLGTRRVRVEGAALLDVAPGKGTFVVETARGKIEVLGTRFLVDAQADRTTTAVVRGQVKLASDQGSVTLHAGEQAVAEPGRPPTRGPAPRLSHLVSWAQEARRRDENGAKPIRHGSLFARDPGMRPNGSFGEEYPLPIKQLTVDVVVEDRVARVALDQTFHNPQPRVLEGVYKFAIPPDAALQRLAMYVDGRLTESAVVERMRARRIYEELVYRRIDPALLEYAGTGRLNLRVYPIPAQQDKRLMIAYTQSLPKLYSDWTLSIPLPEVDEPVGEMTVSATLKGCGNCEVTSPGQQVSVERAGNDAVVKLRHAGQKIGDSFVVHVRESRKDATVAVKTDGKDRYMMVRAAAELAAQAREYRPRTWVLLDDVSASRGMYELKAQADLVDAFLRELDEDDRVSIVAFDVEARTKLAPTRVRDVDRRAVRQLLKDEGTVGGTDFGKALDAALTSLAGVAADDAMVVYLGDGVITSGPRGLDALRGKLAGKAHFIGVGVGDGPDTQTLEALAASTGGYATTIDLADDVGWRAFDLVAALHTSRVTGVSARLLDASGALVPSAAYLRSPQLADGEEIELVAKLASDATPTTLELSGTRNGAAWQQRIALGTPTNSDAGFLPRQWAQHHIAARLLAKHEAVIVPPCSANPCKTEDQLRQERDEQIRQDIVTLGKQYFLLSRHTSLLVLENDAMYAKYGVRKGGGDTWAPYAMPAKIPVVTATTAPVPDDIAADAELVRSPLQIFYDQNYDYYDRWEADAAGGEWGTLGTGTFGTIGHGSGTGQGFGVGGGGLRGRGDAVAATRATGELTRATLGLANKQQDSDAEAVTGPLVNDPLIEEKTADKAAFEPLKKAKAAEPSYKRTRVASDLLGNELQQSVVANRRVVRRHNRGYLNYGVAALSPMRFHYPNDPSFDDLSALIPALFSDAADEWRLQLVDASGGSVTGFPITDAAKQLLTSARANLAPGVYQWAGLSLAVDTTKRLGWKRETDFGVTETASYDGAQWSRRYTELGITATRTVKDDDVALGLAYLPIWIADPAHYARYFVVGTRGPREVTLSVKGDTKDQLAYVMTFDAQSHLVSISDADGVQLLSVTWGPAGPTAARVVGGDIAVGYTAESVADATSWAHGTTAPGISVELPSRIPSYWQSQIAKDTVGSPTWRHAQRQLLVSAAALGNRSLLATTIEQLRENGGIERGDVVLASGSIVLGMNDAEAATTLAPIAKDPIARYLIAARKYNRAPGRNVLDPETRDGAIGALWTLRAASARSNHGDTKGATDLVVGLGQRAFVLRLIGAASLGQIYPLDGSQTVRVWESVAQGEYKNVARAALAQALYSRGEYDQAAEQVSRLAAEHDLNALPPRLNVGSYVFSYSRRGQAGWQLAFATWRDRVLAGSSFEHVMALLPMATYRQADIPELLERARVLAGDDVDRKLSLAHAALQFGQPAFARQVIEPMLAAKPTAEVLELAAQMAQTRGSAAEAFGYLERAQDASADEAVDLDTVRTELRRLLSTAQQAAVQSTGAERAKVVARALEWGKRWRTIDPGNDEIDRTLGTLLLAVGDGPGAWRQLSSIIERDPWSGAGYAAVAEQLEQQGKIVEALDVWQQAIVIDQTNPQHRLRKAQTLIALGKTQEGDALLEQITTAKWHEMWQGTVYQAKSLLERGKPKK